MTGQPVLLDTDFSDDADDLLDIAVLCQYQVSGVISLKGVLANTSISKAPGAIDTCLTHMAINPFPDIGCWKGTAFNPSDHYGTYLYDNYSHPHTGLASTVQDGVDLARQILAARPSQDLWIIANGPLHQIQGILNSTADAHSSLNGSALLAAKCAGLMVIGGGGAFLMFADDHVHNNAEDGHVSTTSSGTFVDTGDYNLTQRPAASHDVFANWPAASRLVQVPIGFGYLYMVATTIDSNLPGTCPIRDGFDHWATATGGTGGGGAAAGRQAWTQPAFSWLNTPDEWRTVTGLTMSADVSTGVLTVDCTGGNHEMLYPNIDPADFITEVNTKLYAHGT